jgi:hypothetical protein
VKLTNGTVLSMGGDVGNPGCCVSDAVTRYDLVTNTITFLAPMLVPRVDHTATLLPSGQILIVGGTYPSTSATELYDPTGGGQSQPGASLTDARRHHLATLLPNGDVLITGGFQSAGPLL